MARRDYQILEQEYYKEYDPIKRKDILNELLKYNNSPADKLRQEIYKKRYKSANSKKSEKLADGYMGLWMTMKYNIDNRSGIFGYRRIRRELERSMNDLGSLQMLRGDHLQQAVIKEELRHLGRLYTDTSRKDKSYGSVLMGLSPLSDEKLAVKLTEDVYKIAFLVPVRVGMQEELTEFSRAISQGFYDIMPDGKEYFEQLCGRLEEK